MVIETQSIDKSKSGSTMSLMIKIVLIGDGAVGKTTLRNTYMGSHFEKEYLMTMGADFSTSSITVIDDDNKPVQIIYQIWDLAGQPKFNAIRALYYSGTMGALLVYDVTRWDTFENTINWLLEFKKHCGVEIAPPIIILGNKIDLRSQKVESLSYNDGLRLAKTMSKYYRKDGFQIPFYETSAKTGDNVDLVFHLLGKMVLSSLKNSQP